MKYIIIFVLVSLQSEIHSQTKQLDSFLDIKWGSNQSTLLKKMNAKENVELVSKSDTLIVMKGGNFAGREVWTWQFYFWQDQFFSAILYLSVSTPIYLDDMYDFLQKDISDRYGPPKSIDSTTDQRGILWIFDKSEIQKDDCFILMSINYDPFFGLSWLIRTVPYLKRN